MTTIVPKKPPTPGWCNSSAHQTENDPQPMSATQKTAAVANDARTDKRSVAELVIFLRPNDQAQPRRDARSALREVRCRRRAPSAGAQGWASCFGVHDAAAGW